MKIKIIDLLNKIANGEESINVKTEYDSDDWKKNDFLFSFYKEFQRRNNYEVVEFLNDYVEIIEEPKKIEKWGEGALEEMEKCTDYTLEDLQKYIRILAETQNELIDEINNLKEK